MAKVAYVAMAGDLLHPGHINILNEAGKYGRVVVGLLTDHAIASYKRMPLMTYEERKSIIQALQIVSEVIPQDTLDYRPNLYLLKPDFVVHGDDWKTGIQKPIRDQVIETLNEWGGILIEPSYTQGVSSTLLHKKFKSNGITTDYRRRMLRRILAVKPIVRIIESHSGLSAMIADSISYEEGSEKREYDAIWLSSLTDSTLKGKPDIELIDFTSRLATLHDILEVTQKPILFDGDTGGQTEHFYYLVRTLERVGVSGVVIEDKRGLKRNSLLKDDMSQVQESVDEFCKKIRTGKKAQVTQEFMIFARIESFNTGAGLSDSLHRAQAYINAGCDGIMIHSKQTVPDEIFSFTKQYMSFENKVPLVVVPSTYPQVSEDELIAHGVDVVIYANQLLRSAYPAMKNTAYRILKHKRALEVERDLMSIGEIVSLIPEGYR